MSITSFNAPGVWAPFGTFSHAVVQGQGHIVHLKGQIALDAQGNIVGRGDMAAQVRQVLANLQSVLEVVGGRMADIFQLTQHVTDIDAFMAAGEIRRAAFRPPYPVTTTVEVRRLFDPALLVEISGIAEVPGERFRPPRIDSN